MEIYCGEFHTVPKCSMCNLKIKKNAWRFYVKTFKRNYCPTCSSPIWRDNYTICAKCFDEDIKRTDTFLMKKLMAERKICYRYKNIPSFYDTLSILSQSVELIYNFSNYNLKIKIL